MAEPNDERPQEHTCRTHLFYVIPSFKLLKKENSFLCFLVTLNFVLNNQRKLRDLLDAMT